MTALHTVHLRVTDAGTGKPTPVRLRLTDGEGRYYPPLGRLAEFATGPNQDVGGNLLLGLKPFAYIDGACEVPLPAGRIHVEIHKGPDYLPIRQEVTLSPGKLALRFTVERWSGGRFDGWHAGDGRAHFLTPHGALLEAAAEGLAVVNLLATECRVRGPFDRDFTATPNLLAFSGQAPALQSPGHLVVVNTHNTHPVLGSLGLLNCHRVVYPLSFGGPDGHDDWTLADWCDQCHRKGGLVVWTNTGRAHPDHPHGEALADLVLGKVDAFELTFFEDSPFDLLPEWYTLLRAGLRVPLVGASAKDSNGVALGRMRTHARLLEGEPLTYKAWIEAVRAGRTFVTNGPLLRLTVAGEGPGGTVTVAEGGQVLSIRAEAASATPFDRLELLHNGEVVARVDASGSPVCEARLEIDWPAERGGWLAARCVGQTVVPDRPAGQRVFAHTSPMYVQVAGQPAPVDRGAAAGLVRHLKRTRAWAEREARCPTEKHRRQLTEMFEAARQALEGRQGG